MKQSTQRQKVEAKETAILDAAHSVFAESGVDGAKISVIAKRAGVAEGTIYLYYRNKAELLDAVVGRFWRDLTEGASASIAPSASALEQLEALARYHLMCIVDDYAFVSLTTAVRHGKSFDSHYINQIRGYVRLFDDIVHRGMDRGEIDATLPVWQLRDMFYGSLEYSARTLTLHGNAYNDSVITTLMRLIKRGVAVNDHPPAGSGSRDALQQISDRLERIESALKRS